MLVELWATLLFMSMALAEIRTGPIPSLLRRMNAECERFQMRSRPISRKLNGQDFRSIRGMRAIALRRARGHGKKAQAKFISRAERIILTTTTESAITGSLPSLLRRRLLSTRIVVDGRWLTRTLGMRRWIIADCWSRTAAW